MPLDDQIYPAQVWTIQELEGSYTIVGRGANRVLEGYEDLLNLFICTAPNIRLKRVEEGYGVPAAQAEKLLDSADKNCAPYLKHDTGQAFGVAENCYLCIDSGKPGIENADQWPLRPSTAVPLRHLQPGRRHPTEYSRASAGTIWPVSADAARTAWYYDTVI